MDGVSDWKFSKIPNIEESIFDKTLERFLKIGVKGLTRENIQNSLDGFLDGSEVPVKVKINTGTIHARHIPGIEGVKNRIRSLEGHNSYAKEAIEHMQSKLDEVEVPYISFEDMNTKGLTGASKGQNGTSEDTWGIYAYNKGVHYEEEDSGREIVRGGSHGIGKIASNAASNLNVMYFANCDANGEKHLGGTVQLIEHVYQDQAYRSTGYFTDVEYDSDNNTTFYPYENNFHEVFKKDTRGLKIIIPYLREKYSDEKSIIKSVCDSFFVSILDQKLEVQVNDKVINKYTIIDYVNNGNYYEQEVANIRKNFTPLYLDTYLYKTPTEIKISHQKEDFYFNLYFQYDENIPRGRVAIVRTVGMKIEDFRVVGHARKPFNAVLIGGTKEDAYLKSLENESHTKLSKKNFNDPVLNRQATWFINNISRVIGRIIEDEIRKHNPVDGMMETDDILYTNEMKFEKDLRKGMETVKINKGRSLVKASGRDLKKERRDRKIKSSPQENADGETTRTRNPLKWQKSTDEKDSVNRERKNRYSAHPDIVQRIILQDKELIKFDFTESTEITGAQSCNLGLTVIDGMGIEYEDEFSIEDNYSSIVDMNTGKACVIGQDMIKGVHINSGIVQLKLKPTPLFNRSLKFVYYVEV